MAKPATTDPQFPIYIPSKGRAKSRLTVKALERMGVPFHVVVEQSQLDDYAQVIDRSKLLVLDPAYQRDYDTFDALGDSKSKGPGPARNFIWDHAISRGYAWHWVMDDNIRRFYRLNRNLKVECFDGTRNTCLVSAACGLRNPLQEALNAFIAVLDRYTIADLVSHPATARRMHRLLSSAASTAH